jgi:hypothetical protein
VTKKRDLYLYEVVDIVGQGQYEYMEHLWKDPVLRMPEMFGLQGSFYVCAAGGGRWPQVVNIWDIGSLGWEGWASNVDRMNLKRRRAFYGEWWDEARRARGEGHAVRERDPRRQVRDRPGIPRARRRATGAHDA